MIDNRGKGQFETGVILLCALHRTRELMDRRSKSDVNWDLYGLFDATLLGPLFGRLGLLLDGFFRL